jgi:hypothetical protein
MTLFRKDIACKVRTVIFKEARGDSILDMLKMRKSAQKQV